MGLLILWGCPAQWLGVELPEGGAASISQEDLQRDTLGLSREDAAAFFQKRMEQMHVDEVVVAEGSICGRIGDGERRVEVPWAVDVRSAALGAVLISVAKGFDGVEPESGVMLCMVKGARELEGFTLVGSLEELNYVKLAKETRSFFEKL
jgi:hypothetical protein